MVLTKQETRRRQHDPQIPYRHPDQKVSPVADKVGVEHNRVPAEEGNSGGTAKGEVSQLIALGVRLADLRCEANGAHLEPERNMETSSGGS